MKSKLQREFSRAIDDVASSLIERDDEAVVRKKSCGAPGASLYLIGPLSYDECLADYFFESSVFCTAIRLRLGMPVHDSSAKTGICPSCNLLHCLDDNGYGAQTCMKGGQRTTAHNELRDTLSDIMTVSLMRPQLEACPFAQKTGYRLDIVVQMDAEQQLVDVAITHPLTAAGIRHAVNTPGGAATAYERKKHERYGAHICPGQRLRPFIVDAFGAMGDDARELTKSVVPLYARRLGLTMSVASRIVTGRLTGSVVKSMAKIATSTPLTEPTAATTSNNLVHT